MQQQKLDAEAEHDDFVRRAQEQAKQTRLMVEKERAALMEEKARGALPSSTRCII